MDKGRNDYADYKRMAYSLVASSDLNEEELLLVAKELANEAFNEKMVSIHINIWSDESMIGNDASDVAVIDWGPDGKWGNEDSVKIGDYSTHDFTVNR